MYFVQVVSNTKRVITDRQFKDKPDMEAFVQEEMARCGFSGAELIVVSVGSSRASVMPYGILSNFDGTWEGMMGLADASQKKRHVIVDLDEDGDPADARVAKAKKMVADLFREIRRG